MKKILSSVFLFVCTFPVLGQSALFQVWNYQNIYNPATCGLYYLQEANIGHERWVFTPSLFVNQTVGSYSIYLKKPRMGLGVSFVNENYPFIDNQRWNQSVLKISGNKQLEGKQGAIYSFGLSAGVDFRDDIRILQLDTNTLAIEKYELFTSSIFTSDVGFAFRWKRWNANMSINHFVEDFVSKDNNSKFINYHFYTEYVFGKKEGFQITPQLNYFLENGFQQVLGNLMLSYKTKYSLGFGVQNQNIWFVTAAWNIRDKFRISYSLAHVSSGLNNAIKSSTHHFNLAFLFGKRDLYPSKKPV